MDSTPSKECSAETKIFFPFCYNSSVKSELEPFSGSEIIKAEQLLARVVPKAGDILRKYYQERNYSTKQKDGVDFTTQADIETDEYLRSEIVKIFPNCRR